MNFKSIVVKSVSILVCSFIIAGCSSKQGVDPKSNVIVPKYTKFTTLDAKQKTFKDVRGKNTVVIFWAQWCRYSRPVIKRINEIAKNNRHRKDLYFLAISLDKESDYEVLKEEIQIRGLSHLNHAFSGAEYYDEAFMILGGDTLPTVYILDASGKVIAAGTDEKIIEDFLSVKRINI